MEFSESPQAALDGADCLVIITEWKEFRSPDFEDVKRRLRTPVIIDGRNLYEPSMVRSYGLEYSGIGRT
jgi:UDPglucose 6-dehydrogenase